MTKTIYRFTLCAVFSLFASCAGYQLGGIKPTSLRHVHSISVPMMANATQHPRASALATSALTNAVIQDGTYKLTSSDKADAILEAKLSKIDYRFIRGSRLDSLYPEELTNTVTITWTLKDARDPTKVLMTGISLGNSQLSVSNNLQTARNNALPEALERASESLVSRIANGF